MNKENKETSFAGAFIQQKTETASHQPASKMKLSMPKGIRLYFPPSQKVRMPQAIQRAWNLHIKLLPYYKLMPFDSPKIQRILGTTQVNVFPLKTVVGK